MLLDGSNPVKGEVDSWRWEGDAWGLFSVSSAYRVIHSRGRGSTCDDRLASVWKLDIPSKAKNFVVEIIKK